MDKLIKYNTNSFCFILFYYKRTINKLISIWGKSPIPFTFSCFLPTTCHSLLMNIFTFYFCYCG